MGDCLERMSEIPDGSVDMILCDLPYGSLECVWDEVIPFAPLWAHYWRVAKPNAAIVLTASQPFTTKLIASQIERFAFSWVWNKMFAGNFMQAKRQPMKTHEDVVIFCKSGKQPLYFPQMEKREKSIKAGSLKGGASFTNRSNENSKAEKRNQVYDEKYPISILNFTSREERGLHPTQKPVALFEYLIRTYTNEGDTVLDNCAGSGTTAIAAEQSGRNWICIERDPTYYCRAVARVVAHVG